MPPTATQQQQPHLAHAQSSTTQYMPGQFPHLYSKDTAAQICSRLALGQSLIAICTDPAMPSYATVQRWLSNDVATFREDYARAKHEYAHYIAEECMTIADSATAETAQVCRLQVDTRKWYAGKVMPKVYGDRPADIQINTQVNVTLPEAELRSLQQRKLLLLEERQAKAMSAPARLLPARTTP